MKGLLRKTIPLLLGVAMTLGLATTASAAFTDFTDVKGHWAEKTLSQAYQDKILMGYDTKIMAPDSSVTPPRQ